MNLNSKASNLPNIAKDGTYVVNLDEYELTGTHWVSLYVNGNKATYFDSFGVEHIPEEIKKFIDTKNNIASISRVQAYDSITCGYFCIGFIDFIFNGKSLINFANLFFPPNFEKNDKVILNCFWNKI